VSRRAPGAFAAELTRLAAERLGLARLQLAPDQVDQLWSRVRLQPTAAGVPLSEALGGGYVPWDALVEASTVRETYFFRHPEQLELVRKHVLPELCAEGTPLLRFWSAGCASGEEAYSLAMLCDEEGLLESLHVLGTDVCRTAIQTAISASYREWSLRGVTPEQLERHFVPDGPRQRVRDSLRRHVTFRVLNLTDPYYPNPFDGTSGLSLICCRNVLMYLDPGSISRVAGRLFASLLPGGFLLMGPSDPPLSGEIPCDVLVTRAGLLYRKPALLNVLRAPLRAPASQETGPELARWPAPGEAAVSLPLTAANAQETAESDDAPAAVRGLWNERGAAAALARCSSELERAPGVLELHYLRSLLLWELGRFDDAVQAMRMVLYLDRNHAIAHFGLGALYESAGEPDAAVRCYRNVIACCDGLDEDEPLPLGDGICASGLRRAAMQALGRLAAGQVSA